MDVQALREHLCETYPDLCPLFSVEYGDGSLTVDRDRLSSAAGDLKALGFDVLGMVTAVDCGSEIELVYRLQSRGMAAAVFLRCRVPATDAKVPSMYSLWPSADWQEREVFDLFGVRFEGHPDLRRILLPDEWEGHPLRKDYRDERIVPRPDYI